jgi:hypothetical protein
MNLPGFPVAQHGETFASVIARYLERSAGARLQLLKLFGLYFASPSSVVPPSLRRFASILPPGHPWEGAPEVIAKDHTLLPLCCISLTLNVRQLFSELSSPATVETPLHRWEFLLWQLEPYCIRRDSAQTASRMT